MEASREKYSTESARAERNAERAACRARAMYDDAGRELDQDGLPEPARDALASTRTLTGFAWLALQCGRHAEGHAMMEFAATSWGEAKRLLMLPYAMHGAKFNTDRGTAAATEAHTANRDARHEKALHDLRLILRENPLKYRTAGGRINARKLAKNYRGLLMLRAPLGETSLRTLISEWEQEGKLTKTPT